MAGAVTTFNIYFNGGEGEPQQPSNPAAPEPAGQPDPADPTTPKNSTKQSAAVAIGISTAKKTVGYVTSRIGEWTGDVVLQERLQTATKLMGYAATFAVNPYLGAANLLFDVVTTVIDTTVKRRNEERIRQNALTISGLADPSRNN
jgi:hypothetical protein